jgi:hypothetical protein
VDWHNLTDRLFKLPRSHLCHPPGARIKPPLNLKALSAKNKGGIQHRVWCLRRGLSRISSTRRIRARSSLVVFKVCSASFFLCSLSLRAHLFPGLTTTRLLSRNHPTGAFSCGIGGGADIDFRRKECFSGGRTTALQAENSCANSFSTASGLSRQRAMRRRFRCSSRGLLFHARTAKEPAFNSRLKSV